MRVLLILSLVCTLLACDKNEFITINSNGNIITQEISLPDFTGVLLDSGCDVFLKKGNTQKVSVKISDNLLSQVNDRVVNGIWKIDFKDDDGIASINDHTWEVHIESPNISYIENDGSGSIYCIDTLTNSPLSLKHLSSGETHILCSVMELKTTFDGSGFMTIAGQANTNEFIKDGGGDMNAFGLSVQAYTINKDGGGDSEIRVENSINGTMDGGGNVYYKGMPATISVYNDGGGSLIDAN